MAKARQTSATANDPIAIDHELVRELAQILSDTGLTEIEVEQHGTRVRVQRAVNAVAVSVPTTLPAPGIAHSVGGAIPPTQTAGHPITPPEARDLASHPGAVKSPMVGTAYLASAPGAKNFVSPGAEIKEGQTIMIVEAMKTMNQIHAPRSGRITHIFVDNGQPVEYGEPLVIIE